MACPFASESGSSFDVVGDYISSEMAACLRDGGRSLGLRRVYGYGPSASETGRVGGLSFKKKWVGGKRCNVAISAEVRPVPAREGRSVAEAERLDRWMRDSVAEIVSNLGAGGEAAEPLLVQVYGGEWGTRVRAERAAAEDWKGITGRWSKGEEPAPEGIILVEEIKEEGSMGNSEEEEGQNWEGSSTKAWGVLLMGKAEEGGVASYLLKTTRVRGHSCNCTHFSLVKVKSFRESARSQLTNAWLVRGN